MFTLTILTLVSVLLRESLELYSTLDTYVMTLGYHCYGNYWRSLPFSVVVSVQIFFQAIPKGILLFLLLFICIQL